MRQTVAEELAALRQPRRDRPSWTAQLSRRLLNRPALEVAKDKSAPVMLREPRQLLVQHGLQLARGDLGPRHRLGGGRGAPLALPPSGGRSPRLADDTTRDPVQPRRHGGPLPDASRVAGEDEEGGLEGVL